MEIVINILIQMLCNLSLTIIIELGIALLLRIKEKKDILNLIVINCITNPILNYIMMVVVYLTSNNVIIYFLFFLFEIMVIDLEYRFYKKKLVFKKISLLLLSIMLNISSLILGLIISVIF